MKKEFTSFGEIFSGYKGEKAQKNEAKETPIRFTEGNDNWLHSIYQSILVISTQ